MAKLDVDKDLIRDLAELLEETGLSEIEMEDNGRRLRVARGGTPAPATVSPPPVAAPASESPDDQDPASHPGVVHSPMVGTVYLAAEPGAAPFVTIGDKVSIGQPLVIIEAMKTMNQIPAPIAGTVTRILIADSEPVEFDDPLMVIE